MSEFQQEERRVRHTLATAGRVLAQEAGTPLAPLDEDAVCARWGLRVYACDAVARLTVSVIDEATFITAARTHPYEVGPLLVGTSVRLAGCGYTVAERHGAALLLTHDFIEQPITIRGVTVGRAFARYDEFVRGRRDLGVEVTYLGRISATEVCAFLRTLEEGAEGTDAITALHRSLADKAPRYGQGPSA